MHFDPDARVQGMSPLSHGFLKNFTSGRYHRGMKILKILLASNSKRFRVYGVFKRLQIDDDKGGSPNTIIS